MGFLPSKAVGFRDVLERYQGEIVDGIVKKKWVVRPRVSKVKSFDREYKSMW